MLITDFGRAAMMGVLIAGNKLINEKNKNI